MTNETTKKIKMETKNLFQSKIFRGLICGVIILIVGLLIFKAGMIVGEKKAGFSYGWGENYHRNFGGPPPGFFQGLGDRDFMAAHGTFGKIIKIDGQTLTILGPNNIEKSIVLSDQTVVNFLHETLKSTDLKLDQYIVVIGQPNDASQIEAKLIRVMPNPAENQPGNPPSAALTPPPPPNNQPAPAPLNQ